MARTTLVVGLCAAGVVGWSPAAPMHIARPATAMNRAVPLLNTLSEGSKGDREQRLKAALVQMQGKLRQARKRPAPEWMRRASKKTGAITFRLRGLLPVLFFAVFLMMRASSGGPPRPTELPFSAFMSLASDKATSSRLTNVRVSVTKIAFVLDGSPVFARMPRAPYDLVQFMHRAGLDFAAAPVSSAAALVPLAFPLIWLGALYSVMRKQMTGATKSVGKRASARLDPTDFSFEDVAGVPDALVEVREIVDMLQDSSTFDKVGARLPAGVLMVGPPGTGKTLLARVMAAQARVPFFYCSGSDFVELFIGRGAARMRALFKEASEASPSIIFIDELDALGKQRAMRMAGNDEVRICARHVHLRCALSVHLRLCICVRLHHELQPVRADAPNPNRSPSPYP